MNTEQVEQEQEQERARRQEQVELERELERRQEQVRARRLEQEADPDTCSWCGGQVPNIQRGTGVCNEWHAELFRAEQEGRDTCCPICPEQETEGWPAAQNFTLSQLRRGANTCSAPHRKVKYRLTRRGEDT